MTDSHTTPPRGDTAALQLHALRHAYAGKTVLRLDSLTLAQGEQVTVLGPSGCGKTTLLHIIAGLLQPTQGQVVVNGQPLAELSSRARDRFRGRHLGIIFQRLHLLPALTVQENLLLAQRLARVSVDRDAAQKILERLGISQLADAKPAQLSVGQAQRVAVARALIHQPHLLLADEPTSSLDDDNAQRTLELLQEHARAANAALLVVTHDQRLRGRVDRELVLEPPT